MGIFDEILYLAILGVGVFLIYTYNNPNDKKIIKKFIFNILTFVLLFQIYCLVIHIIIMISISMMSFSNPDEQPWALLIVFAVGVAPILSIITTTKLNKRKQKTIIKEQVNK